MGDEFQGMVQIFRSKKHPSQRHDRKRPGHANQLKKGGEPPCVSNVSGVSAVAIQEQKGQKKEGMNQSPNDKRPIGTVPKSADEEDDKGVAYRFPFAHPRTAEWDIEVIAEPRRKADVPASPEFGNVTGEVRRLEIGHERYAKQPRRPNGDVAVSTEVSVDLEGKVHRTKNQRRAAVFLMVVKHVIDKNGACVGNDDFFEKAPQNQLQPTGGDVCIELASPLNLGEQG